MACILTYPDLSLLRKEQVRAQGLSISNSSYKSTTWPSPRFKLCEHRRHPWATHTRLRPIRYLLHPNPKPRVMPHSSNRAAVTSGPKFLFRYLSILQSPSLGPCFNESKLATGLQTFSQPCHVACGVLVPPTRD